MYKPKDSLFLTITKSAKQSLLEHPLIMKGLLVVFFGSVLFALMGIFVFQTRGSHAQNSYSTEDIVYDQPVEIRHEQSVTKMTTTEQTVNPDSNGTPQVFVPVAFYDFGSLPGDSVVQKDFIVVNSGSAILEIQRAYTTCGCTTAHITAMTIPPGKASLVTITFQPGMHAQGGTTVRRGIIFETNDPVHPQMAIWIQAKVKE